MSQQLHEVVKDQFTKQAPAFSGNLTLANKDYLQWMVDNLQLESTDHVLDVAAGTGHLSRAMAPYVRLVVSYDLTPAMIEQGQRETQQAGLTNIMFELGAAESLPYEDCSFDVAVTRFAIHHFADPRVQVAEMARVVRPGGKVVLIDLVSPEDAKLAESYNNLERQRDPSHTRALCEDELKALLPEAGLKLVHAAEREIEVTVERWLNLTQTPDDVRSEIYESLHNELSGRELTGMRPFIRRSELLFTQTWVIVVGVK